MTSRRGRRTAVIAAVAVGASAALASCGSDNDISGSGAQLTWYINPDGGGSNPDGKGQAQLARECTEASGGEYTVNVQILPNSASDQRQQLLRRLAASDKNVDIMSVDPVFMSEFAEAGFLAPVPDEWQDKFVEDRVDPAIEASTWKDTLYASPFWANTQLLWYRESVAEKAGLDMENVTWPELIEAAEKEDTQIGVQASRYEGYMVFINALVEGAGGKIVDNPGADADDLKFGLTSEAGKEAASVIQSIAETGVGGPALGSTDETTTLDSFQNDQAAFMVNWPYVYAALKGVDPEWIDDLKWARYPATVDGEDSKPPIGGIELAVNQASEDQEAAWKAVDCLSSEESQKKYMLGTGNPAARKAVFDDEDVKKDFPMAELIRESLDNGAPRPLTQYYGDISSGIQRDYSPPSAVNPDTTPEQTTTLLQDVLRGDALL